LRVEGVGFIVGTVGDEIAEALRGSGLARHHWKLALTLSMKVPPMARFR